MKVTFCLASGMRRGDPERTAYKVADIFDSMGSHNSAEAVIFAKENGFLYFEKQCRSILGAPDGVLFLVDFDEVTAVQFVLTFDWKPHARG